LCSHCGCLVHEALQHLSVDLKVHCFSLRHKFLVDNTLFFLMIIFALIDFCKRTFRASVIILFCTPCCNVFFHYHTETFKMRQPASFPFTGSGLLRGQMNQMSERSSRRRDSQEVLRCHGRIRLSFGLRGKSLRISSSFHNLQGEYDESTSG
jgi:hypothetical protein